MIATTSFESKSRTWSTQASASRSRRVPRARRPARSLVRARRDVAVHRHDEQVCVSLCSLEVSHVPDVSRSNTPLARAIVFPARRTRHRLRDLSSGEQLREHAHGRAAPAEAPPGSRWRSRASAPPARPPRWRACAAETVPPAAIQRERGTRRCLPAPGHVHRVLAAVHGDVLHQAPPGEHRHPVPPPRTTSSWQSTQLQGRGAARARPLRVAPPDTSIELSQVGLGHRHSVQVAGW